MLRWLTPKLQERWSLFLDIPLWHIKPVPNILYILFTFKTPFTKTVQASEIWIHEEMPLSIQKCFWLAGLDLQVSHPRVTLADHGVWQHNNFILPSCSITYNRTHVLAENVKHIYEYVGVTKLIVGSSNSLFKKEEEKKVKLITAVARCTSLVIFPIDLDYSVLFLLIGSAHVYLLNKCT